MSKVVERKSGTVEVVEQKWEHGGEVRKTGFVLVVTSDLARRDGGGVKVFRPVKKEAVGEWRGGWKDLWNGRKWDAQYNGSLEDLKAEVY